MEPTTEIRTDIDYFAQLVLGEAIIEIAYSPVACPQPPVAWPCGQHQTSWLGSGVILHATLSGFAQICHPSSRTWGTSNTEAHQQGIYGVFK